jgi:peptide/nickel transport system substrate-binding protein
MSPMDRRSFLGTALRTAGSVALLGAGATLMDGCTSGSSSATSTSPIRPRYGGRLNVAVVAETNGLDPTVSSLTTAAIYYARSVFDPLTAVAADGSIRPYLAQAMTPNTDYTVWTIRLRPNVLFHDGTNLDADALLLYFSHVLSSPTQKLSVVPVLNASKVDHLTVNIKLAQPWVAFPAYLSGEMGISQLGFVAAPAMLRDRNGAIHPVGTGPFVFREWVQGDHFSVTRNPHYWRRGLPYLSAIQFRPIVDDTSRRETLLSGAISLMQTQSTASVVSFRSQRGYHMIDNLGPIVGEPEQSFVMLNTQASPLNDVRVRRGLAYATDQRRLLAVTQNDLVPPSNGPFAPGTPYYSNTDYPTYDPVQAQAAINGHGGAVSFSVMTTPNPVLQTKLELLQDLWRRVGIKTSITTLELSQLGQHTVFGKYDAVLWEQFGVPDPDLNYNFWTSKMVAPPGQLAINLARNADPEIDTALERGRTSANPVSRAAAYQTIAKRFAADLPYIWLGRLVWAVVAEDRVHGFERPMLPDGTPANPLSNGDVWLTETYLS